MNDFSSSGNPSGITKGFWYLALIGKQVDLNIERFFSWLEGIVSLGSTIVTYNCLLPGELQLLLLFPGRPEMNYAPLLFTHSTR